MRPTAGKRQGNFLIVEHCTLSEEASASDPLVYRPHIQSDIDQQ